MIILIIISKGRDIVDDGEIVVERIVRWVDGFADSYLGLVNLTDSDIGIAHLAACNYGLAHLAICHEWLAIHHHIAVNLKLDFVRHAHTQLLFIVVVFIFVRSIFSLIDNHDVLLCVFFILPREALAVHDLQVNCF